MSLISIIRLAIIECISSVGEVVEDTVVEGSQPLCAPRNSYTRFSKDWSLQTSETRRQLSLLCAIPAGQLAMLESTDYDMHSIGSGIGFMSVQ